MRSSRERRSESYTDHAESQESGYRRGGSVRRSSVFVHLAAHPPSERRRVVKHRSLAILRNNRHLLRASTTSCRVTSPTIRKIQRLRWHYAENKGHNICVSVPRVCPFARLSIVTEDRHITCSAHPSRRGCVIARFRVVRREGTSFDSEEGGTSVPNVAEGRKGGVLQVEGRNQQAGRSAERGCGSRRGGGHRARGCDPADGTLEGVLDSSSTPAPAPACHHTESAKTTARYVTASPESGSFDPLSGTTVPKSRPQPWS